MRLYLNVVLYLSIIFSSNSLILAQKNATKIASEYEVTWDQKLSTGISVGNITFWHYNWVPYEEAVPISADIPAGTEPYFTATKSIFNNEKFSDWNNSNPITMNHSTINNSVTFTSHLMPIGEATISSEGLPAQFSSKVWFKDPLFIDESDDRYRYNYTSLSGDPHINKGVNAIEYEYDLPLSLSIASDRKGIILGYPHIQGFPSYTVRIDQSRFVDNNGIYEFQQWESIPSGSAEIESPMSIQTNIKFLSNGATIKAVYTKVNEIQNYWVHVASTEILTIPAGANYQIAKGFGIEVDGSCKIQGTKDNEVIFNGNLSESGLGVIFAKNRSDGYDGRLKLEYVRFNNTQTTFDDPIIGIDCFGSVYLNDIVDIKNCTFNNCPRSIRVEGAGSAPIRVVNCTFYNTNFEDCYSYGNIGWNDNIFYQCILPSTRIFNTCNSNFYNCTNQSVFAVSFLYNFAADPKFISSSTGNFYLQGSSPCIDEGTRWPDPDGSGTASELGAYDFREIQGSITTSQTWMGSIGIIDNTTITNNTTQTFSSGTCIYLKTDKSITVNSGSKIISNGSASNPVHIMRADPDCKWGQILFYGNNNDFKYTLIDGGSYNLYFRSTGNNLEHCTSQNAYYNGIKGYKLTNGNPGYVIMSNCLLRDNKYGAYFSHCDLKMENCTIEGNTQYGIELYDRNFGVSSTTRFKKNYIYGNGTYGIYIASNCSLSLGEYYNGNNKIVNNGSHEIYLSNWSSRLCAGDVSQANNGGKADIYDYNGGYYIYNLAKTSSAENATSITILAENNFWNSTSSSYINARMYGPVDHYPRFSSAIAQGYGAVGAPTVKVQQAVLAASLNVEPTGEDEDEPVSPVGILGDSLLPQNNLAEIGQKITELKEKIAGQPFARDMAGRLIELYYLRKNRDKSDQTGERNNIMHIIKEKQALYLLFLKLNKAQKVLSDTSKMVVSLHLAGEVALILEINDLIADGQYEEALDLIEKRDKVIFNSDNRRELLTAKINALEGQGEYKAALATLEELREEVKVTDDALPGYEAPIYDDLELHLCTLGGIEPSNNNMMKIESLENMQLTPEAFALKNNYPNPFNPTTTIPFQLPEASHVKIVVYNTLGRKVAELTDNDYQAGDHKVTFEGSNLASGIYFIRAQMQSKEHKEQQYVFTSKMVLIK